VIDGSLPDSGRASEDDADDVLSDECIYAIAKPSDLQRQIGAGQSRTEKRWWADGKRIFDRVHESGMRMPVLFADAETDCSRLFGWALLDEIERHESGTRFSFSKWRPIRQSRTQELVLIRTGVPIAPEYRRSYSLCQTPWFLRYKRAETPAASVSRAWVVKGKPGRNDLDEMLRPHEIQDWITKRPPKGWSPGDAIFFWKGSPACEIVGFGRITKTTTAPNDEGDFVFEVEYLTGPFAHRLGLAELRADDVLGATSFVKSGPAGTVFPLAQTETQRLATLILDRNPSCAVVFEDHLFGSKSREIVKPVQKRLPGVEDDADDDDDIEGRQFLVTHLARERNGALPKLARQRHRAQTGGLRCTVCDFDFGDVYGPLGVDFAEVHHAVPLSTYDPAGEATRVEDLVIVCANCHRMLHRRKQWLAAGDLKVLLRPGIKSVSGVED
jgi:HNH endonuclease